MSVVKFLCPNGHPLNAPINLVGKGGKCPKCGTAFLVPSPDEENTEELADPSPSSDQLEAANSSDRLPVDAATRSGVGGASTPNRADAEKPESFQFLCPNGHKLSGPVTMKGKLGSCPHCKSKFRIPSDDDLEEDEDQEESLGPAEPSDDDSPLAFLRNGPTKSSSPRNDVIEPVASPPAKPTLDREGHPLGQIMERLWGQKGKSGDVELSLTDGETYSPDYYAAALSQRDFGVFGTNEGGTYSFRVLPWSAVTRVSIHKVEDFPSALFGEE